jgi:hypothetical protein
MLPFWEKKRDAFHITVRKYVKKDAVKPVVCIRIDPDPAFYINAAVDPGTQANADPSWSDFKVLK